ncbi:MAG: glycosyltransferase family 4 protein [Thermoplasmata archaeon]
MHILMLSERWFPSIGGGEYHIRSLSAELVKLGCSVTLISRSLQSVSCQSPPKEESHYDGLFRVYRVGPTSHFTNLLGRAMYIPLSTLRALRVDTVDILHAQSFSAGLSVLALRGFMGKPGVLTVHGTYLGQWHSLVSGGKARIYERIERAVLFREYDRIITVDKHFLNLAQELGYPTGRIVYIPNGVDLERFAHSSKPGDLTRFLFVGRIVRQKGLENLVRASSLLKTKGLNFSVSIVGVGPLEDEIRILAHDLGVEDHISFFGHVSDEDLVRMYSESDAFVLPSVWEGLPLTLLEAWAAGLPVIATDVGGIRDLCRDGENALVVPSRNDEALAEAMQKLIEDRNLQRKLGANGRNLVASGYTWSQVAKRTMEVYEELLV